MGELTFFNHSIDIVSEIISKSDSRRLSHSRATDRISVKPGECRAGGWPSRFLIDITPGECFVPAHPRGGETDKSDKRSSRALTDRTSDDKTDNTTRSGAADGRQEPGVGSRVTKPYSTSSSSGLLSTIHPGHYPLPPKTLNPNW